MTSKISDVISTAYGVFFHSIGNTQNGINLIKKGFLVNVTELIDCMLLIHFSSTISGRQYNGVRKEHRVFSIDGE